MNKPVLIYKRIRDILFRHRCVIPGVKFYNRFIPEFLKHRIEPLHRTVELPEYLKDSNKYFPMVLRFEGPP